MHLLELLIDEELRVWLLELKNTINLSLTATTELADYSDGLIQPLMKYVKRKPVHNAVSLARVKQNQAFPIRQMGHLTSIYQNYANSQASSISDSILLLKELFFKLTLIRNKTELSVQIFVQKMSLKPFFTNVIFRLRETDGDNPRAA